MNLLCLLRWGVHLLTAAGGILCIFATFYIIEKQWIMAFYMLCGCLMIDAIDGTLARKFAIKKYIPQIDGALLDNLIDFLAYVFVPCIFIYYYDFLMPSWKMPIISLIILASCYQFCHVKAKTADNFFTGFPCYWNLTIFYMMIVNGSYCFNLYIFILLITLVFVPIKYLYLSRMNNVSNNYFTKIIIYVSTAGFGISSITLLIFYPNINNIAYHYSLIYMIAYGLFSVYRTLKPINK